jgi:stage V sporulation protein G
MEISEVRIFPRESEDRKLKAYATITIDNAFVVRNVKVIEGNKGLFVAMPSRKLREACPKCRYKNAIRSRFCNQCGGALPQEERRAEGSKDSPRQSGHRDIAHPITPECREYIQKKVLDAYQNEIKQTGAGAGGRRDAVRPKKEPPAPKEEAKPEEPKVEDTTVDTDTDEDFEGDLEL